MEEDQIQTPEDGTENVNEDTQNLDGGESPETQQESANESQQPAPQDGVDYKTKFSESTRENQILQSKVRQYESRRELTNEPTEAELKAAFPSWEFMTETEKDLAKGQLRTERKAEIALSAQKQREENEKWDNELEIAIASNPSLQGKESEFKKYASKPTHKGAPVDILVDAFLHRSSSPIPKKDPKPGLETGSGGPKDSVKPKKISLEEASVIRKTDYKRYLELVKSGQIEDDL